MTFIEPDKKRLIKLRTGLHMMSTYNTWEVGWDNKTKSKTGCDVGCVNSTCWSSEFLELEGATTRKSGLEEETIFRGRRGCWDGEIESRVTEAVIGIVADEDPTEKRLKGVRLEKLEVLVKNGKWKREFIKYDISWNNNLATRI